MLDVRRELSPWVTRDAGLGVARRDAWLAAAGSATEELLARRLEWDGMVPGDLEAVSASSGLSGERWLATLGEILRNPAIDANRAGCGPCEPLPFEELWADVVSTARSMLESRIAPDRIALAGIDLAPQAHCDLQRSLMARLSAIGEQAIYCEFRAQRSPVEDLRLMFLGAGTAAARERYDAFVSYQRANRLQPLFLKYPVMARLVATAVDQWVEAVAEFQERLCADAQAIMVLLDRSDRLVIQGIRPDLSDPHHHGRKVMSLHFAGGGAVVYKPKPLAAERALANLLAWCNARFPQQSFRVLRMIDCASYGWVEYVEHSPCRDIDEVAQFYRRMGSLLCILHCLRVSDGHRDNLIAAGEFPVFVDAETVMHPDGAGRSAHWYSSPEEAAFEESVLRTGLLPRWLINADLGLVLDVSALGGTTQDQTSRAMWRWNAVNTDAMHRCPQQVSLPQSNSEAALGEGIVSASAHVEDLVQGYSMTYRDLVNHREALLAKDGPIAMFAAVSVRFLFRPTVVYAALLDRALSPQALADGVTRSLELDAVTRAFLDEPFRPQAWEIIRHELLALERMDVPCFMLSCGSTDLPLETGEVLREFFQQSELERVCSRIAELGEHDLAFQCRIIRGAFSARTLRIDVGHSYSERPAQEHAAPLTSERALEQVRSIARMTCDMADQGDSGEFSWLMLQEISTASRYQLQPAGEALYAGSSGIALFLAALASVDGKVWRQPALAAIAPLRKRIAGPRSVNDFLDSSQLGAGAGIGSVVYALARISAFLDDPGVLADAIRIAKLISDARLDADVHHDVIGGCAGVILALLAVERADRSGAALERAVAAGQRLLDRQERIVGGGAAWSGVHGVPLTGFSHGAAGIAHALTRLAQASGQSRFLDAAAEAIAYERAVFDVASGNWPDLRGGGVDEGRRFAMAWCHGAPGIALGRLGNLDIVDDRETRAEIEAGLRAVRSCGARGNDILCCGTMGRIETLLTAADRLSRPDLRVAARATADVVVHRACESGSYRLAGNMPASAFPGLFCGLPGIGYQLLRIVFPERIPSVLLWE